MADHQWRVQATWTVGEDFRSYVPVFVESAEAAEELADEMRQTLAHFPTLQVLVSQVALADAEREMARQVAARESEVDEPLHLRGEASDSTACGLPLNSVRAWARDKEMFGLSSKPCSACTAAMAQP